MDKSHGKSSQQQDAQRKSASGGEHRGDMSVSEAGHKGGVKGGQRVRELVEEGREAERGKEDRR